VNSDRTHGLNAKYVREQAFKVVVHAAHVTAMGGFLPSFSKCKSLLHDYTEGNMGWFFRKSINLGPVRMNLSKSGVGTSWGFPGFRFGISPDGRKYIRIGLTGTGLCWVKYF